LLVLATDVFGGTGGIAQYTRDFVAAAASYPPVRDITVIPRVIARAPEPLPEGVTYVTAGAGGKARFIRAVLRASASRPHFDWIICAHVNLLSVAHAAAAISGAKVMLLTYGIEVWAPRGLIARALIARTHAIVSISSFTLDKMRRWAPLAPGRAFLIPNAIDLAKYSPGAPSDELIDRWSLKGRRVLLTVGRMDAREQAKGFDEILEAMPRIVTEFPDVVYVAVGDGSDRARLQAKARQLGVTDFSIFPGYVTEAEKLAFYGLADVFVMPSRLEGFGYVFLEALAMGCPVIASKLDGSREAVRNGEWGILVDPADPAELSSAIRSALEKPRVPDRKELDFFSWNSFERRCHAAFDLVLLARSA
jgi:glycosyltransferase involved in cell wall biosynthesis